MAREPLRVLELYSGIGGMHCALLHAQKLRAFRRQRGLTLDRCCCGGIPRPLIKSSVPGQSAEVEVAAADRCTCMCGLTTPPRVARRKPEDSVAAEAPAIVVDGAAAQAFEALTADNIPLDGSSYCVHPLLDSRPHTTAAEAQADASPTEGQCAAASARAVESHRCKNIPFEVVAAVDVSDTACAVYRRNFCRQQAEQQPHNDRLQQKARKKGLHSRAEGDPVCLSVGIERLPLSFYENAGASLWVLAPPCQPFARRGLKQDFRDARCASFLQLLKVLQELPPPALPRFLLLENVGGFEKSEAYELLMQTLIDLHGYECVFVLLLNPLHFGLPNCRSRCFVLARKHHPRDSAYAQWLRAIAPYNEAASASIQPPTPGEARDASPAAAALDARRRRPVVLHGIPGLYSSQAFFCCPIWPLEAFLEHDLPPRCNVTSGDTTSGGDSGAPIYCKGKSNDCTSSELLMGSHDKAPFEAPSSMPPASREASTVVGEAVSLLLHPQAHNHEQLSALELKLKQKKKAWHIVDLVTRTSARSSCFTRNYGKSGLAQYGSILLIDDLQELLMHRQGEGETQHASHKNPQKRTVELHDLLSPETRCRFFSVREQLRLHGFPSWFAFTDAEEAREQPRQQHGEKQQYRLMIGNSLNVYLVGMLLDFLIGDDEL
ncbi:tRNA (cytosine-5-)-methyltransferase-like [Cyclospora cayetanensis]|uniref:tRNA (Cytosine-5-)-methyltransferase-like n=1 Tax=Cyclospora cayetanensis TaxID=88456 RepID=A0A6P6RXN7_9EIME|nr:tRNA (cytosine-5-)-methyltransferase-like [Cyclospora cayetanensis]